MAFRVLVSDPLAQDAVDEMKVAGLAVDVKTDMSPEELIRTIPDYEAIVVRGLDNIDVKYAQSKGIEVRNTPGASTNSVAELALGHILSLARHIARGTVSLKNGKWEKKALKGVEIAGKTLGIVGIGRIGRALAEKAHALGMSVIAFDKFVSRSPLPEIVTMVGFDELLTRSDFISLHIPFDPNEGPAIGKDEFEKMKDGVRIVNCARGGVIDEEALAGALSSGKVAGAALDVFATEPPGVSSPLFAQENLSLTPHIGASTVEAQGRVGTEAAKIVIEFAKG